MLSLPPSVRVFLCLVPADMRWSFDSLARVTAHVVHEDPLSGHLFVFRNRRGDRLKILYWDRDGYALWYKRLEQGAFRFPAGGADSLEVSADSLEVSAVDLALVLEGIDVAGVKRHKRYRHHASGR